MEKDNKRRFLRAMNLGMKYYQHMIWYIQVDKVIDNDDLHELSLVDINNYIEIYVPVIIIILFVTLFLFANVIECSTFQCHFLLPDLRRSNCYQDYSRMFCSMQFMGLFTRSDCCCSLGAAWGDPCAACPRPGTGLCFFTLEFFYNFLVYT